MNEYKDYWDKTHEKFFSGNIKYDNWLDQYEDIILNTDKAIIDLGCGEGNNTKYLVEKNKKVIACDFSDKAIDIVKSNFDLKDVSTMKFDMSGGLPFKDSIVDLIVADLSLHYFDTKTTIYLLSEIKRILTSNGHLAFRVNSVRDTNYGATGGVLIENNYYFTDGYKKRFFDKEDIETFFKNFEIIDYNEDYMRRYGAPKILWKGLVRNN